LVPNDRMMKKWAEIETAFHKLREHNAIHPVLHILRGSSVLLLHTFNKKKKKKLRCFTDIFCFAEGYHWNSLVSAQIYSVMVAQFINDYYYYVVTD
jgi:hypothetical protein